MKKRATTAPGPQGTVLDVTMQGDGVAQSAYTIPAQVGPNGTSMNLQLDTGSSDLWVTSTECTSQPSCSEYSGPKFKVDATNTTSLILAYQGGSVSGPIVSSKVAIGGYTINAQPIVAASSITNEDLALGEGVGGLLGLGLQSASVISQQTNDSPTVPTTLLSNSTSSTGLSSPGPSTPFISLLLERPFYPPIPSLLGLGQHPSPLPFNLSTQQIQYTPIVTATSGPSYWRVPITAVTPSINGAAGNVPLGSTTVAGLSSIWPVAKFDSSVAGMTSSRSFANAFYGSWGIGPGSQDGLYYVPCDLSMNVTFALGEGTSIMVPIHPLDMSGPIPSQTTGNMCLGSLQASDSSIPQADIILGTTFLRNVYMVLSYQPSPQVGILPLTNSLTAFNEFTTVRTRHQLLYTTGLSPSQSAAGYSTTFSDGTQIAIPGSGTGTGNSGSTKLGLKILGGVAGFLILSGLLLWVSVRILRKRMQRAPIAPPPGSSNAHPSKPWSTGEEGDNVDTWSIFGTGSEKPSRQRTLAYIDSEEAFAMFGSGAKHDRVVDIFPETPLPPTEPEQAYQLGHRPQHSSGGQERVSEDSLLGVGAFRDSRYPPPPNPTAGKSYV